MLHFSPEFLLYTAAVVAASLVLMLHYSPLYGQTNILVDLGICSMIGSLTVSRNIDLSSVFLGFFLLPPGLRLVNALLSFLLQVMSIKAVGIAIKLTVEGTNQVGRFQAWVFAMVAATCIIIQLNYLNKVGIIFYAVSAS